MQRDYPLHRGFYDHIPHVHMFLLFRLTSEIIIYGILLGFQHMVRLELVNYECQDYIRGGGEERTM